MRPLWIIWGMGLTGARAPSSHVSGFIAVILSVKGQSISALRTENLCDLPLTQTVQYFFFFGNCPSLIYNPVGLCHIFWCSVCLTTFILNTTLIPPGENLSAAFDPTYIFISCEHPQCSIEDQLQVWACSWSRAMAGLRAADRSFVINFLFKVF